MNKSQLNDLVNNLNNSSKLNNEVGRLMRKPKNYFDDCAITQEYISVFASGMSILDLSDEDIERIKSKSFLITLNYAPIKIKGHMNIWSDDRVTDFLNELYRNQTKDILYLVRKEAFKKKTLIEHDVDFWFDKIRDHLCGIYTILWLFMLINKYQPRKKVLVFGMDADPTQNTKWYDNYIDFDKIKRGKRYKCIAHSDRCTTQIDKFVKNKQNFLNCNPNSGYNGFKKVDWREIL
jgi:hypothetical protein